LSLVDGEGRVDFAVAVAEELAFEAFRDRDVGQTIGIFVELVVGGEFVCVLIIAADFVSSTVGRGGLFSSTNGAKVDRACIC